MPNFDRNRVGKAISGTLAFRSKRISGGKSVDLNWKGVGPKISEYLLLGGGGSGGFGYTGSGGGGGGGIVTGTVSLLGDYSISIGGGGSPSTAFGQTAPGGGGGGVEGPWGGGYGVGSGGGTGNGGSFPGGAGGSGATSSITGSSLTYGGGGGAGGANYAPYGSPGSNTSGYGGGGQGSQWGTNGGGGGVLIVAYPSSDGTLTIGAGVTSSLSTVSRSGYNVYTLTGAGVITA